MNCSKCNREIEKGESSIILVDPKSEWWKTLFNSPLICNECAAKLHQVNNQRNEAN
jgi:hypothetical protein